MNGETVDVDSDAVLDSGSVTVKDGVLTLNSDNLDEVADGYRGLTYREQGFTKYQLKMIFKK